MALPVPPSRPKSRLLPAVAIVLVAAALVAITASLLNGPNSAGPDGGSSASPTDVALASSPTASASASPGSGETLGPGPSGSPGTGPTSTPAGTARPSIAPTPRPTVRPTPRPTAVAGGLPVFRHVYVVVMENEEATSIVGNANAPYINSLIGKYGLATNYTAVAHPSEPNYIALFSGSTFGVTDDGTHDLAGKNLADQIEAKGRDWRVFAQNLPDTPCYTGGTASGGPDGSGTYARKHNPAISFTDISSNPARCAKIENFSHFSPSAADYELIVPNLCNDMHDCGIKTGDTFLKGFLPKILDSAAMKGSVLFLTWDEGKSGAGGGGKVATVVIGDGVPAGFTSGASFSHYSLVRTIEDSWGLGCLANSCKATDMGAFWP